MNFTNKPPEWENEGTEPTEEIKKWAFRRDINRQLLFLIGSGIKQVNV